MIYPSEADIIPFFKSLTQALLPYAKANDLHLSFSSGIKKQVLQYQPFLLSQSFTQLVCNIINMLPPKSYIKVRLMYGADNENLQVEVANNGLNLIRVNAISTQTIYSFTGIALSNGTLYSLTLPLHYRAPAVNQVAHPSAAGNNIPQFYKEVQKRMRSHFTQSEKLIATLEKSQPQEAAFMQKINAVIKVHLGNENFDTNALCKTMSLSRTQLFRKLKLLIKQAPANHIKFMRLQKAKELLESTDHTISEITFKTGFQAVSHFTKVFKKQYGILPSVYRNNNYAATNE